MSHVSEAGEPAPPEPSDPEELSRHCLDVIKAMRRGDVVPFFGAGVNLCNRPPGSAFTPGKYLPDGKELTRNIREEFKYPWEEDKDNLLRVAWHAAHVKERDLKRHLHDLFDAQYPPTDVHKFFAKLPRMLREKGYDDAYQLIVTTNYDYVLESAFEAVGEPYDVVSYIAFSEDESKVGMFRHFPHGRRPRLIKDNARHALPIDEKLNLKRTIILKIHGAVDRRSWTDSGFVITEDDYVKYLARPRNPSNNLPNLLVSKLKFSSLLFLGYSLSDWNLRVFLSSIGAGKIFTDKSWAVMYEAKPWDTNYWDAHNVKLRQLQLADYIKALKAQLDSL